MRYYVVREESKANIAINKIKGISVIKIILKTVIWYRLDNIMTTRTGSWHTYKTKKYSNLKTAVHL